MKILVYVLLMITPIFSYCQKKKDKATYNTKIDTAGKVEINGGKTTILKADTVFIGQLLVDHSIPTEVYFLGSQTIQDSAYYTTIFKFAPKYTAGTFNINVVIQFDKEFTPWSQTYPPPPPSTIIFNKDRDYFKIWGDNGKPTTPTLWTTDLKSVRVRGLVEADNIYVAIKSKQRLFATISGISGEIKN